jgi:hypothetical protein
VEAERERERGREGEAWVWWGKCRGAASSGGVARATVKGSGVGATRTAWLIGGPGRDRGPSSAAGCNAVRRLARC